MNINFDKFNLSQKIYSASGVVIAILTFMIPENYFPRISIGLLLLTAIVVFFLKYNIFRKVFNFVVILLAILGVGMVISRHIFHQKVIMTDQAEEQLLWSDDSYYSVCVFKLLGDHEVYSDYITKCPTQLEAQQSALSCPADRGLISKEVVRSNEKIRKMFNNLPVGDWYIQYQNKVGIGMPSVEVFRGTIDAGLEANFLEQLALERVKQFKDRCKNADCTPLDLRIISPYGKVTQYNVSKSAN